MRKIQESIRSLATKLKLRKQKKGFAKQVPIRSNHFPVYVGDQELDEKLNRYDVPVACTSSIIFQALLRQFEDILRVEEGPITISCSKQMFESVLKLSLRSQVYQRLVIHEEVDGFPPLALSPDIVMAYLMKSRG